MKPLYVDRQPAAIFDAMCHELNDEAMAEARRLALNQILEDGSARKLVVAGPGTGKTFTFQQLLARSAGPNLALTFLNGLASELEKALGDRAEVYSFHGFARRLLHTLPVGGVTNSVDYYPAFDVIAAQDLSLLGMDTTRERIQEVVMNLLDSEPELAALLRAGEYYDVVGYDDSVYRVLRHFQAKPEDVPVYAQIVVDEYQDFNRMEIELIEAMAESSPTLVAGDDDQALYTFRHASADFLRGLVLDDRYANFELPFCSRCPEVIVNATHRIVERAQANGLLTDRIPKDYVCYLPEKRSASEEYPTITHVRCSVETNKAPYIEMYLHEIISAIPDDVIQRSRAAGHPTVLVIGPRQFSNRAYAYLREHFGDVSYKMSTTHDVRPIDGYKRLMQNPDSRLGWRILLHVLEPPGWEELIAEALNRDAELVALIPDGFKESRVDIVKILQRIAAGDEMTPQEMAAATNANGLSLDDLLAELGYKATEAEDEEEPTDHSHEPSILVTSLMGAKGLQAERVFVLGLNGGHFPSNNLEPSEAEVCKLLVALTRSREHCTLVSVGNFGGQWVDDSVFMEWLAPLIQTLTVDKSYFSAAPPEQNSS